MELKKSSLLIILYFLLFSQSFAQGSGSDVGEIISGAVALIVILGIILLLLLIGGVIKRPTGRIPGFLIFFIVLIILLFLVPMFIPYPQYLEIPQELKQAPLPSYVAQIFIMLGLPQEWMYMPAIIYLFILPFAAIYALVWAFLQSLGIFTNVPSSINRVLAFIVAFLTIPMGWFVKMIWILFSFMGAWSVVIFVATFIVGVFFRGLGVGIREFEEYRKFVLKSKKEAQEIVKELEIAKQGTVDIMKKAISDNLEKVKAIDSRAHRVLNAALLSNEPEEVRKLISEAIEQLKRSS